MATAAAEAAKGIGAISLRASGSPAADAPDDKEVEKMVKDAGLTDDQVVSGLSGAGAAGTKVQVKPVSGGGIKEHKQAVAGGSAKAGAGVVEKKELKERFAKAKAEEQSMDNKMEKQLKKMGQGKMDSSDDMGADIAEKPLPPTEDDEKDGEGDGPVLVGVPGTPQQTPEQVWESKLVYGALAGVVLFTVWWTNGTPSSWHNAVRFEVKSATVPGYGGPSDWLEESPKRGGKKGAAEKHMTKQKQTELPRCGAPPDLL